MNEMKNKYPQFKLSTPNGVEIQEGYVDLSTIDDDEPVIMFYDEQGFENTRPRKNRNSFESEEFQAWEDAMLGWIADDEFLTYMWDFQDENRTFQRPDYILVINEGENNE